MDYKAMYEAEVASHQQDIEDLEGELEFVGKQYARVIDTNSVLSMRLSECDHGVSHWEPVTPGGHNGIRCAKCKARISHKEYENGNHRFCYKCGSEMLEV